ncbi:hypothetical protein ACIPJG_33645 [Streptomyces halstedii]|uniref:hypothetical protein n=1 Tax=Streptomyces halstedii TaxID=1944 RepID=UPI003805BAE2
MSPNQPKNPTRPIRVDLTEWGILGEATNAMGSDRSAELRAFMDWYLHKPGTKAPTRPSKAVVDAARKTYLEKEAAKRATEAAKNS